MSETVNGVLVVVKPPKLTSHDVVDMVRRLSGIRRIGHTGTLDPLATGLLILCIGRATRLAEYIVGQAKTYEATIYFGRETTTYDAEGETTLERPVDVTDESLVSALEQFRGQIYQVPPMFSAIKVKGQRLYKHARLGREIERQARRVTIFELEIMEWKSPELRLRILCSSGTYIRSLAHDLGRSLGCGAYLTRLTRTAIGNFTVEQATTLTGLDSENWLSKLMPLDAAVWHLPKLILTVDEGNLLASGQKVSFRAGQPEAALVRAYDSDSRFVGVVNLVEGRWKPRKIFVSPHASQAAT
jgi:tRNA pseudouridine55 synthase